MKAGDAKGVPFQMKWLNASEVWKPAPRLKIESPWSGTNAAVKTRPSTSDRPYAASEITIPPYECPTRIFGPEMPSSNARTIATSPAIDNRPSVGVTVVNPSFCSPATTMSQPGGEAQAARPRRRGRGRSWAWSRNCSRARSPVGSRRSAPPRSRSGAEAAVALRNGEPRWERVERMRRSYKNLRETRLNRVYKGETDRDYIDGSWVLPAGSRSIGKQTRQAHQEMCQWKVSTVGFPKP